MVLGNKTLTSLLKWVHIVLRYNSIFTHSLFTISSPLYSFSSLLPSPPTIFVGCRSESKTASMFQSIFCFSFDNFSLLPFPYSLFLFFVPSFSLFNFYSTASGNDQVEFLPVDLVSLKSVNEFVEAFKARGLPLHALVDNAGKDLRLSFFISFSLTSPPVPVSLPLYFFLFLKLNQGQSLRA